MKIIKDLGMRLPTETAKRKRRFLLAECEWCGEEFMLRKDDVHKTNSCGCRRKLACVTHGLHKHKLYAVHAMILQRCNNPKHPQYKDWGGRGIVCCDEWQNFMTFYEWATKSGYVEGLQIDRKDNDGNYEPDNCRFVTPKENMNNRRCSKQCH